MLYLRLQEHENSYPNNRKNQLPETGEGEVSLGNASHCSAARPTHSHMHLVKKKVNDGSWHVQYFVYNSFG